MSPGPGPGRAERAGRAARLRALLDGAVARGRAPGVQLVVVDRDGVAFDGAAGLADLAEGRVLEPATTMMAYSMTKTITAVAALQLVEQGRLALDAPVRALVPECPYDPAPTIRQLLSQTSGIPDPIPLRWVHLAAEEPAFDERAMLQRRLREHPRLRFPPGTRYAYSNLSYWLLGRAIEAAGGRRYADQVREGVLARLGLSPAEAAFAIPDPARHARGYLPRWSPMRLALPLLVDRRFIGAPRGRWLGLRDGYLDGPAFGGLVASARAVGRFLADQLAPSSALLGPVGTALLHEEQRDRAGRPVGMTLGWHVAPRDRGYLFKEGGGAGFHSEMRLWRAGGVAAVAIANSGAFDAGGFLDEVARELEADTRAVGIARPLAVR